MRKFFLASILILLSLPNLVFACTDFLYGIYYELRIYLLLIFIILTAFAIFLRIKYRNKIILFAVILGILATILLSVGIIKYRNYQSNKETQEWIQKCENNCKSKDIQCYCNPLCQ